MDNQQRGRSPSAGHASRSLNHSRSPSAQAGFNNQANAHGADPTLLSSGNFEQRPTNHHRTSFSDSNFLSPDLSQQFTHQSNSSQHSFDQFPSNGQDPSFADQFGPTVSGAQNSFTAAVDPRFLDATNVNSNQGLDHFLAQNPQQQTPNNQDDLDFLDMNTPAYGQYPPSGHSYHNSLSQPFNQSATLQQGTGTGTRSRGQSLSPSSAAMPPGQMNNEWAGIQFQGHRRDPSADAFSDVSSHHSPFVDAMESFDTGISPNLQGQNNSSNVNESLPALGQFSISDHNIVQSQHTSPGQSNHVSPHMSPQHGIQFEGTENFGVLAEPGPQMFETSGPGVENFPQNMPFNGGTTENMVGNQMAPEINIQFAGPERQPTLHEPGEQNDPRKDALSPPSRSPSRRGRALSDPYSSGNASRSSTPARPRAPSLGLPSGGSARTSRSPSPSAPPNGVSKPRDRASSTPSIPVNRDYMIGLADPERAANAPNNGLPSTSPEGGRGRGQKHPATFQCSLCPKRFTRAYNLRSHLRTHTDERPFVCTVCGKAFARQHDRKRHEGLHSGEKKFVCKGFLGSGAPWGCGRRFARADALGRHFRSEAGRACIKPLLEEEARERRAAMMEQASQDMINQQQAVGMQQPHPQQMGYDPNAGAIDMSGMTLPAALLAQYPALAGIQWDALPPGGTQGGVDVDEDEFNEYGASGRSSFDASSGGELELEDDGSFDPSVMGGVQGWNAPPMGQPGQMNHNPQWAGGYGGTA